MIKAKASVLEVIKKRRSIREYSRKRIDKKHLNEILKAGQFAPCGSGIKEWEFVVIKDRRLLEKLSKFKKSGSGFLANADAAIVILGNKEKYHLWIEDCSLAADHMMLQAAAFGIGSCWIQVRSTKYNPHAEEDIRKILTIPKRYGVLCLLSLGYSIKKKSGHTNKEFDKTKIHYEKF